MPPPNNDEKLATIRTLAERSAVLGQPILRTLDSATKRLTAAELQAALTEQRIEMGTFETDLAMLQHLKLVSGQVNLAVSDLGRQLLPLLDASGANPVKNALDVVLYYDPLGPKIVRSLGEGSKQRADLAAAVGTAPDDAEFGRVLGLLNLYKQSGYADPIVVAPVDSDLRSLGDLGRAVLPFLL